MQTTRQALATHRALALKSDLSALTQQGSVVHPWLEAQVGQDGFTARLNAIAIEPDVWLSGKVEVDYTQPLGHSGHRRRVQLCAEIYSDMGNGERHLFDSSRRPRGIVTPEHLMVIRFLSRATRDTLTPANVTHDTY